MKPRQQQQQLFKRSAHSAGPGLCDNEFMVLSERCFEELNMYGPAFRFKVVCCAAFNDEGSLMCFACFYALTSINSRKSVAPVQRVCLFHLFVMGFAHLLFAGLCACKIMN